MIVFPEGAKGLGKPWRSRYRLERFGRSGFVEVALRVGAPIVPCAVVGGEIHPRLAELPRRAPAAPRLRTGRRHLSHCSASASCRCRRRRAHRVARRWTCPAAPQERGDTAPSCLAQRHGPGTCRRSSTTIRRGGAFHDGCDVRSPDELPRGHRPGLRGDRQRPPRSARSCAQRIVPPSASSPPTSTWWSTYPRGPSPGRTATSGWRSTTRSTRSPVEDGDTLGAREQCCRARRTSPSPSPAGASGRQRREGRALAHPDHPSQYALPRDLPDGSSRLVASSSRQPWTLTTMMTAASRRRDRHQAGNGRSAAALPPNDDAAAERRRRPPRAAGAGDDRRWIVPHP